jgi:hypothetical protein
MRDLNLGASRGGRAQPGLHADGERIVYVDGTLRSELRSMTRPARRP